MTFVKVRDFVTIDPGLDLRPDQTQIKVIMENFTNFPLLPGDLGYADRTDKFRLNNYRICAKFTRIILRD